MDWNKVNKCNHELSTSYLDAGTCVAPFCTWRETHCTKCGVYIIKCDCGYMNRMSGEPYKKKSNRERKKNANNRK